MSWPDAFGGRFQRSRKQTLTVFGAGDAIEFS
jgi:hypothetical protein